MHVFHIFKIVHIVLNRATHHIFSKVHKYDNSGSRNPLKLSFIIIEVVRCDFFECESFFESVSPDILALCERNLEETIQEVHMLF